MGFFSWKTQNSNRSIANSHSSNETFDVTMTDNKGGCWHEKEYEGYGEFGGKDFFELLAEMNGLSTREDGITIVFSGRPYLSPNLYEGEIDWVWVDEAPESCEHQGYFY